MIQGVLGKGRSFLPCKFLLEINPWCDNPIIYQQRWYTTSKSEVLTLQFILRWWNMAGKSYGSMGFSLETHGAKWVHPAPTIGCPGRAVRTDPGSNHHCSQPQSRTSWNILEHPLDDKAKTWQKPSQIHVHSCPGSFSGGKKPLGPETICQPWTFRHFVTGFRKGHRNRDANHAASGRATQAPNKHALVEVLMIFASPRLQQKGTTSVCKQQAVRAPIGGDSKPLHRVSPCSLPRLRFQMQDCLLQDCSILYSGSKVPELFTNEHLWCPPKKKHHRSRRGCEYYVASSWGLHNPMLHHHFFRISVSLLSVELFPPRMSDKSRYS